MIRLQSSGLSRIVPSNSLFVVSFVGKYASLATGFNINLVGSKSSIDIVFYPLHYLAHCEPREVMSRGDLKSRHVEKFHCLYFFISCLDSISKFSVRFNNI